MPTNGANGCTKTTIRRKGLNWFFTASEMKMKDAEQAAKWSSDSPAAEDSTTTEPVH